jgi:HEAT repeat protein
VAHAAEQEAVKGLEEIVEDEGDREVRKSAIFAISRRPADESVPTLIRVARTHRDPEIRKSAIFWLGQSKDPRALRYFEEVLLGER